LCREANAIRFKDMAETRGKMLELCRALGGAEASGVLCHVDFNPDNVIKLSDGTVRLVDWEYAGMADPLLDVAMFGIYSYYDRPKIDWLLEIYLKRQATSAERLRLYIYTALGGYLWALWSEYKQAFGVEFGEYGIRMYRYAKDFYGHIKSMRGTPE
jgi:thiamine kinase-like enzyme